LEIDVGIVINERERIIFIEIVGAGKHCVL